MRVLLANPAFRRPVDATHERYLLGAGMRFPWSLLKHRGQRPRYAMFPFFLAHTAALLERDGFEVGVVDGVPLNLTDDEFVVRVAQFRPDVVVFEPNTAVIDDTVALARRLRGTHGPVIVLAGTHASVHAQALLESHDHLDFVALGEYEGIVLQLLRALRVDGALASVAGLAYRGAAGMQQTAPAAPIDLAALPPPARHLFPAYFERDLTVYHDGFCQRHPALPMHSSRGCPFRCNFCAWVQVLYRSGPQRFRPTDQVVDEMESLRDRYAAHEIYFDDDNFTSHRAHVLDLCAEMRRRRLGLAWSAMADAMGLDEQLLIEMAAAGCIGIKFGLDSADARVLKQVGKPLKTERLTALVARARSLGVKTHMSVVLGLSGETRQSLKRTLEFCNRIDVDSIQFSLATPCPGTRWFDELARAGELRAARWDEYDGANASVVRYDGLSQHELEAAMASAHSRWLRHKVRDPRWLTRQIAILLRSARTQGPRGLWARLRRAARLLAGDAAQVQVASAMRSLRW